MYYGQQNNELDDSTQKELNRSRKVQLISFAVLIILILGYTLWQGAGPGPMKIQWTETTFTITTPDDQTYSVPLDKLKKISFRSQWDPGKCIDGGEDNYNRYGIWNNDEFGDYRLYAAKGSSSVILMKTDMETIVFSYESDRTTKELYGSIIPMLEEMGYKVESE